MRKLFCLSVLGLCLLAGAAHAGGLSQQTLQTDYAKCMGGVSPQQDSMRAQYCACVEAGESHWTTDQYGQIALQSFKTGQPAPAVVALSQSCFAQVSQH
jgi:hypothetical protein